MLILFNMYLLAEKNAVPVQDITNMLPECLPVSKTIRILLSVHERNPIDNHVDVGIRLPMDVIGHLIAVCKEAAQASAMNCTIDRVGVSLLVNAIMMC